MNFCKKHTLHGLESVDSFSSPCVESPSLTICLCECALEGTTIRTVYVIGRIRGLRYEWWQVVPAYEIGVGTQPTCADSMS